LSLLTTTRFDELKATNKLPSPTGVALAIMRVTESEKSTTQEIARIVQTDPALSGRILRIANSAFSGRSRPAASVREAVTHLGGRMVRNVALSFSLISQRSKDACRGFDYDSFWSNSLAMAVSAQLAAGHTGGIPPFEAFTCGLLAQVGRLALATVYPEDYGTILGQAAGAEPETLCFLEREQFATDHNELTGALLRDWGLPEICAVAAAQQELAEPPDGPDPARAKILWRLLRLAAKLAAVCVGGQSVHPERVLTLLGAGEETGIEASSLIALCDQVAGEWQAWGNILNVHTQAVPPFAELAEKARQVQSEDAEKNSPETARANFRFECGLVDSRAKDASLTIVVADDDPVGLAILTRHLTDAGHTIHAVRDGSAALQRVLEINPQLVITDWQMPGMDGMALIEALRKTKMGQHLYIILLTASGEEETQAAALDSGADDCVVKPFNPKLLSARLRSCARVVALQAQIRREEEENLQYLAELAVVNRKLQQAALTDSLTGLYNRRFAMDRLNSDWASSQRTGAALTCLLIDIDHFKQINDNFGHDVGDLALQATANLLRGKLRQNDVCCRMGGEEFLVISVGMDEKSARICGERLRTAVENQVIEAPKGSVRITVSIGVALRHDTTSNPIELLKAADEAVYLAKKHGRNQVRFAEARTR
jgi:diguanylate cyclase (GGDEF)-like protein